MCGIAGLIGRQADGFADAASRHLAHRGPDDSGLWRASEACLVHRRLAILDLSPSGHQPMSSSCGRWHLVFNGEIYNYKYLRHQLIVQGCTFQGTGDTEVLLAWIARYGTPGLQDLRGMFAFCLYDSLENTAILARDPHGIKPLYYWRGPSGELAFASELRALLAWGGISSELNSHSLLDYLCTGSVAEPFTLVQGIHRLPAGHWAHWSSTKLVVSPWCPLPESIASSPSVTSIADAVQLCRSSVQSSLIAHLESDVPVGLFLSGGLDSAALLALSPTAINTFTIGFPTPEAADFDESLAAQAIARHFGSSHNILSFDARQAKDWLPEFMLSQDQPSIDGYNTWCVSRLVRQHGFKVAISGLGGDELFGGYPSFRTVPRLRRWRRRLGCISRPLSIILRSSPAGSRHKVQRIAALLDGPPSFRSSYACFRAVFSPREALKLLATWGYELASSWNLPALYPSELSLQTGDLEAVAWLEGTNYLRNQLLPDSDVMSMAAGLELRLPFVDAELQRQLAHIPPAQRFSAGKQMLRRAVPELPHWFMRRPKQGFRFPFQIWLDSSDSPFQFSLPASPPGMDLSPWYRRWSLLILDQWLKQHLQIELPRNQYSSI